MNKHTKGPWGYSLNHGCRSIVANEGRYRIADTTGLSDDKEDAANARLIAAAPALYEALRECAAYFEEKFPYMDFGIPGKIRAAVAQAEGQEVQP